MKEDLLEIEETTDDTGTTSDIDSLTLNLSSLSNNYILQQRENRRIISLINKSLQKKEDITIIKNEIKKLLLSHNNIMLLRDDKKETLLHIYVKANNVLGLNIILDIYIEILGISEKFYEFLFMKNMEEYNVFDLAVKFEYIPIIKLLYNQLLKAGENIEIKNYIEYLKNNIFNISAENNKIFPIIFFYEKLKQFYKIKTNEFINIKDQRLTKEGMNPILYASKNKNLKLVLYLIDLGANINSQNDNGKTCLHFAVLNNDEKIVKHLLIRGINKNILDDKNINAYNLAVILKHENLIKILKHKNFCQKIFCGDELGKLSIKSSMISMICFLILHIIIKFAILFRFFTVLNNVDLNLSKFSLNIEKKYELNEFLTCFEKKCVSEITVFSSSLIIDLFLFVFFIIFKCSKNIFLLKKRNAEEKLSKLYEMNNNICIKCGIVKKEKTKHCIICNRCVENWDHHCYWLNSCINDKNYCKFKMFLFLCFIFLFVNFLFYIYSIYLILTAKNLFFSEMFNIQIKSLAYYFLIILVVLIKIILTVFSFYFLLFVNLPMIKYICIQMLSNKNQIENIETLINSNDSFNKIFEDKKG